MTYFVAVQIVLLVRIFLTKKAYYHYFKKIIKGRYCEIPLITTALITTTTTTIPSVSTCQINICQNFGQCLGRLFSVSNYKKIKILSINLIVLNGIDVTCVCSMGFIGVLKIARFYIYNTKIDYFL